MRDMAEVLHAASADDPALSVASDSEVSSLHESDSELESAWHEGPLTPHHVPSEVKNGSAMIGAPVVSQRRLERMVNIDRARSPAYLVRPNELPAGRRKQQRWLNDHHFGNGKAATGLEDLMEHMTINVEWKSEFQNLAESKNVTAQETFREGYVPPSSMRKQKDRQKNAKDLLLGIDRQSRVALVRSYRRMEPFLMGVEYVLTHFLQWQELPSQVEIPPAFLRTLVHPLQLVNAKDGSVRLCLPLMDSPFHRLLVHTMCQFYKMPSRTEANRSFQTKILLIKLPKHHSVENEIFSLCQYVRETRLPAPRVQPLQPEHLPVDDEEPLEAATKSSECSEGYTLVDFPSV